MFSLAADSKVNRKGMPERLERRTRIAGIPLRFTLLSAAKSEEHRLDQLLEAERGPHLADEVGGVLAGVAEAMRRPGRDHDAIAGAGDELLAAEPELKLRLR